MAVLLLGEVTNGELSVDATAKAVNAVKALGDVTVLCAGASAQAAAAAFVFARRHPLDVHKQIMQAPTARKPRLPRRFLHTALLLQHLFGMFDADVLQHLFRAHPRPRLKLALQMRRAHMHLRRHRRQRRLLLRVVVKVFNGRRHTGKLDLFAVHCAAPAVYLKPC